MKNKSVFFYYVQNNKKSLIFLCVVFLLGMIAGITFINHASESQTQEIGTYVNSLKENLKSSESINQTVILIQSMKQNMAFVGIIWFLGCTLLGSFLIYGAIFYKGFSIGYTAAAIIATLGAKSRNHFCTGFFIAPKPDFHSNAPDFIGQWDEIISKHKTKSKDKKST